MSAFIYVDGVEISGDVQLPGLQSVSARADGSFTDSGLLIDDPDGSATYPQLSQVVINETASANPRAFTGYVHRMRIRRGPYRDGAGRVHELEVADLNFLLHLRVLTGSAVRPPETFNARIAWLLGSWALNGVVWDDGLVASSTSLFDEADYRGQYADDVLASIAGPLGRIFFVRWDPSANHPSLFCDVPSAAVHSSTLKISNVDTDVDSVTTFAPLVDSDVTGAGEDIYDGVFFQWVGPAIYRTRPATYTTFGVHRDASYETTRIGRIATAEAYAAAFLENHAGQVDTITCTIRLPASKLTLIEAGMRMQVRFSHLPGYETDTWVRVTALTFTFAPGRNDFYDVQLELSNRGLSAQPGGDPGGFPMPTSCTTPTVVQALAVQSTATQSGPEPGSYITSSEGLVAPTAGNTLVLFATLRNVGIPVLPPEWTTIDTLTNPNPGVPDGGIVAYRTVGVGETMVRVRPTTGGGTVLNLVEISGTLTFDTSAGNTAQPASGVTTCVFAAVTPPTGSAAIILGFHMDRAADLSAPLFAPVAGWTEIVDTYDAAGGGHPQDMVVYQTDDSTSGSYTPNATYTGAATSRDYANLTVSFICDASDNPPAPGQWVYWEQVTMTGAVGTTQFPYAPGSLRVNVSAIPISTASFTETDPAAGTFTLVWDPDDDEEVRVDYQGAAG